MPRNAILQTNFSAGEIDPALALRRDTKQYRDGAKSLLNSRVLVGGGNRRRPGTRRLAELVGDARIEEFVVNQATQYVLAFSDARMDAFARDAGTGLVTAAGSLTGCPWTGTTWKTMDTASSGNTIIVTHPSFMQVITRTGASSWSKAAFPWFAAPNGRIHQPHYKIAPASVTLQPSARTGSITGTFSADVLTSQHVGARVRYVGKEISIDTVVDGHTFTGTVIDELPPTQELELNDAGTEDAGRDEKKMYYIGISSFRVGDIVEATVTGAKAEVTAVDILNKKLTVVIINGVSKFAYAANHAGDDVDGPNGRGSLKAATDASPGAVRSWTEQLYSGQHGYPRCVEIHRARILLGGSPMAPNAIAGSSITSIYDFDLGTASDADGFLETVGDSAAVQIVQMHSAEQLLVLTDKGPYYVPETAQNPFRPTSLAFNHFGGSWPCSDVRTGDFDGGVVMVSGSIVIKLAPTGNTTAIWDAAERSFLSPHLIKRPVDACFVTNFGGGPERYCILANEDGTAAAMMLIDAEQVRNFTLWSTAGKFRSFCAVDGAVYAVVRRIIGGVPKFWLELLDDGLTVDGVTEYVDEAALAGVPSVYGSEDVAVVAQGRYHLGSYPPALDDLPSGPYQVGFFFDRIVELLPPNIQDQGGDHSGDEMRIFTASVHTLESARFAINGLELMAYHITDHVDDPPPLRTGPQRMTLLGGWRREPTVRITQPDPLPLTILGVQTKVAY